MANIKHTIQAQLIQVDDISQEAVVFDIVLDEQFGVTDNHCYAYLENNAKQLPYSVTPQEVKVGKAYCGFKDYKKLEFNVINSEPV
jgi:predicted RNA-binding protein